MLGKCISSAKKCHFLFVKVMFQIRTSYHVQIRWCNSEHTQYASIAAEGIVGAVSPQRGLRDAAYLYLFCYSERLEIAFSAHKFDIEPALILLNTSCFIIKKFIFRSLFIQDIIAEENHIKFDLFLLIALNCKVIMIFYQKSSRMMLSQKSGCVTMVTIQFILYIVQNLSLRLGHLGRLSLKPSK